MILLHVLDISFPLKNPVIIFSLVLFIILFAPILFNKIKVPHIIGLIGAGIIIGPNGLNILLRDSSIVLFGTVGLLYIMFTAGLEIDLHEFKKNRTKSLVFGLFTFIVPLLMGIVSAYYILQFSIPSAILLASMFSSHTLLAYPIASKYGLSKIRSVTLAIGGTIITDILALLVLAAIAGMTRGEISTAFWLNLAISTIIFGCIIFFVFPIIIRWFFKKFDDNVSQYIFVLAMVFLGAFLAEVAGLEAIIGAFLSGLTLNRFIPGSSALMNRIEFVGNAFFIPFFLIGVGMLVDFGVIFKGWGALKVAAVMIIVGIISKFIAAWLTQKSFHLTKDERQIIFGLSTARVGATLAVVLVGYNLIIGTDANGEAIRMLNEDVLNGTILMILVTCTVSSFVTERASQKLALQEENKLSETNNESDGKILISLAYPDTVTDLVDLGLMLKQKQSTIPVFALHVISEENKDNNAITQGKKMLEKAQHRASSTDRSLIPLSRFDINISNAIVYTLKEHTVTDILFGLHRNSGEKDFLGAITERIVKRIYETIYIYKSIQPINTLQRMITAIPPRAELEPGFAHWVNKIFTLSKESGLPIVCYAGNDTLRQLQELTAKASINNIEFRKYSNWDDFLILTNEIKPNDLFIIVNSRKGHVSYSPQMDKMPYYLSRYFKNNSFILLYPKQLEHGLNMGDIEHADGTLIETISDNVSKVGKIVSRVKRLLRKNNN